MCVANERLGGLRVSVAVNIRERYEIVVQ